MTIESPGASVRPSAVVLGAGLMGRLIAFALARRGHAVRIHEAGGADGQGAAARVAAAMLAPLAESAVTEPPVVRMGHHALARWPQLLAELADVLGPAAAPVFFQREGTVIVWHRQDAAEADRLGRQLRANQQALPALPAPQALDAAALGALEPALRGRFSHGLYLPGEGQLDNRRLLAALGEALDRLGVPIDWNSPRAPEDFPAGAPDAPGWVVDCRGLGARPQLANLRGVRGEVIRVHAPEVDLRRPTRLVHPRYPLYIAPKEDHLFVIGATEIESEDDSPPSVRSTLELLSAAYTVHSGFAEARIVEIATQRRPALPDNLPALVSPRPGVLQINGLYRHGFMISPALLDVALEWLDTGRSGLAAAFPLDVPPPPAA
ncbi:MAG: FAD-dependent oxidoreductase [Xylophilus ampelinus]